MAKQFKYHPRNDMVVVERRTQSKIGSIHVPQVSMEGKADYVYAVGPKVEGLKAGDRVMMTGERGKDWDFIPGGGELLTIREGNVILVIEELAVEV